MTDGEIIDSLLHTIVELGALAISYREERDAMASVVGRLWKGNPHELA